MVQQPAEYPHLPADSQFFWQYLSQAITIIIRLGPVHQSVWAQRVGGYLWMSAAVVVSAVSCTNGQCRSCCQLRYITLITIAPSGHHKHQGLALHCLQQLWCFTPSYSTCTTSAKEKPQAGLKDQQRFLLASKYVQQSGSTTATRRAKQVARGTKLHSGCTACHNVSGLYRLD